MVEKVKTLCYFSCLKTVSVLFLMFSISVLGFVVIRATHGNPAELILGFDSIKGSKEAVQVMEEELGLHLSLFQQYLKWVNNIIHADFGTSYFSGKAVITELLSKIPKTLLLSTAALSIAFCIGIVLGVFLSISKNCITKIVKLTVIVMSCVPTFWLSLVLLYFVCVKYHWLPVVYHEGVKGLILPVCVLALQSIAEYTLLFEDSFGQTLKKEYVFIAHIKGLKNISVFFVHILRNSLIPLITLIGHNFVALLAGSFVIESIFGYPGVGKYIVEAILKKDYPVVQGFLILFAGMVACINLFIDALYYAADPVFRRDREIISYSVQTK